ncbi:MAG: M16 family metallopeptidase [Pyrinomonadaceae bacterium]
MKEEIQETRLNHGPIVLTDRMPGVRSVTLGFFFRVGSRHEPRELSGISHFIEHTVFKGTHRRSALDIAIEQDRLGGNLEAFTTHEETGFAIKIIDEQLPGAFDLLADLLTEPRFDEADLKSEQRVIIEEMKMIEDSPEEHLADIFSAGYFSDHPLGMSIAGTPTTVRSFDADTTRRYHHQTFRSGNLVITAAGNVDHGAVVDLAQQIGWRQPADSTESIASSSPVPAPSAPLIIEQNENLEQAHIILATPLVSAIDERRYSAELLSNIFGGGTSSRLWQEIREEHGLAYSVGASAINYRDCGLFSTFAATSPDQLEEVVDLIISEMGQMVRQGVTDDELQLAKDQSSASILLSLEDSAARAAALGQSEITYGRQIPVEETLARIASVTVDDVASLANEFFRSENVAFAALGDLKAISIERERLNISN